MTMDVFNPVQTTPYCLGYKFKSRIWGIVNATIFRWTPFFMRKTRIAILKTFGANIDWTCSISRKAEIVDPWNLSMGMLSSIDEDCCIRCRGKVAIGKRCCISRGVYILSASHDISSPVFTMVSAPVIINDNCWIATKAVIGRGITIGEGGVVAAMANVVKDVEPWTVVGGNPAKFIKQRIIKDKC